MESANCFIILLALLGILLAYQCNAQNSPNTSSARSLDTLLQDYAYRAFDGRPKTGTFYNGILPSNLTGIAISVVRLRSGSLKMRGVKQFKQFTIPQGVVVQPYVRRLALVYQNLVNWSSVYYPLPAGFTYLTPILGLLAYNASNLTATLLPELGILASGDAILINFDNLKPVPTGASPKCMWIKLNGLRVFDDLKPGNICSTFRQGHFSIVVNSTSLAPSPSPGSAPAPPRFENEHKNNSKTWKIVVGAVGGFLGLILLAFLATCCIRFRRRKKMAKMEQRAEVGEALHMARVGNTRAPVAMGTRTPPVLENEYVS